MCASFFAEADRGHLVPRLSELVETVSKKPIPDYTTNIVFEVMVETIPEGDEDGEDVEVPFIQVKIR